MTQKEIDRINELARKSKVCPLSQDELSEQKILRDKYREAFKRNLTGQLDNITIVEPDGTKTDLKDIHKN